LNRYIKNHHLDIACLVLLQLFSRTLKKLFSLLMKRFITALSVFAMVLGLAGGLPHAAEAASLTSLNNIKSGDLVRGETFSAVYYLGKDGFRYVFPNDKTYFTWYSNFDSVKWISDADLGTLQIGGNVTYKAAGRMVKINSDPKTYAVSQGGTLRWVKTEAAATALYGSAWNTMIDDVPDAFFGSNYHIGSPIETEADFNRTEEAANANTINDDKDLQSPMVIMINSTGFSPSTLTVSTNRPVKFINQDSGKHSATGNDLNWGTGTLNTDQNFTRYFKTAGTFTYFDSYNQSNMGTIIVQ